jgi:hypothetical protein
VKSSYGNSFEKLFPESPGKGLAPAGFASKSVTVLSH